MANPEHLKIIKQGIEAWNEWREKNFAIRPDLSRVNFSWANLSRANLTEANLMWANLSGADLRWAALDGGVDLSDADLSRANIEGANLSGAFLIGTNLSGADLNGAALMGAWIGRTVFTDIDLSTVKGLKNVRYFSPSSIGIDTIYKSRGNIPEVFLRGCGVPESFIAQIPALVAALESIQFYSCFISYSSKDQDIANRLYADLQNKGVRCWFAPEDLKIGDKFRLRIDESIRIYDKLLLVLSEHSVSSQWVEKEVETAMEREREDEKHRTVLFPVRLDDAVNEIKAGWPADVRRTRHIGDFTHWKDHDSYQKAFDRLLRDLKAGE